MRSSSAAAFTFSSMILFYCYCFFFGGYLKYTDEKVNGVPYTGGKIITTVFCVVFSTFSLLGVMGYYIAIAEGKIASHLAFETINAKPDVLPDEPNTTIVTKESLTGRIEFKDVMFKYPSRDDLIVMNNFSCVFEAGQTTALVGPSGSGKSTVVQLIERFYNPESGEILIDGQNIKSLNLKSFR
jgi:ATP-binding cassette subfamily B (MDR/TAP) protein 1